MSLTVLADVILSNGVIHAGVRGRNKRSNTRAMDGGGFAKVNINWARTLREFELGIVPMLPAQWQEIESLFEATDGGAFGFLLKDPKDATTRAGEGLLQPWNSATGQAVGGIGMGYGVPVYRLHKRYAYATRTTDRLITRPIATPTIYRAGTPAGAPDGLVGVNLDSGTVTFTSSASEAITAIAVGSSTVLTFFDASDMVAAMAVGQRLYITGVTGTAAAVLNGLSHEVTAKDVGAFTLTISTNTSGLVAGAAGSNAAKYPQASETLTWTGNFYTPVHFSSDDLEWDILRSGPEDTRIIAGPSVTLLEVREA